MVVVFFSSWLGVLSDWKNFSLFSRVLAAVTKVRGAAVGLVLIEVVVVKVVLWEGVDLETKAVGLSFAAEARPDAGREEGEVENVLETLGGLLVFSVSHAGPSLDGVWAGVVVLALLESGCGVYLETWVFVGKSHSGELMFVDSNLKYRKHNVVTWGKSSNAHKQAALLTRTLSCKSKMLHLQNHSQSHQDLNLTSLQFILSEELCNVTVSHMKEIISQMHC